MKVLILSLVTGAIVGLVFGLAGLPFPAPQVLPGVAGVVGVWLGGAIMTPWARRIPEFVKGLFQ